MVQVTAAEGEHEEGVPAVMQLSIYVVPSRPPLSIGFFYGCLHACRSS